MELNLDSIRQLLPHRSPILILERIEDVEPQRSGTGVRRFDAGDSFFAGHFPDGPVLPGIYLIEALAQTAMVVFLARQPEGESAQSVGRLARVNEMKFYQPVTPGQTIRFCVDIERRVGTFAFVNCEVHNQLERIAEGRLTLKIG